jgi:hypothetical protein
MITLNVNGQCVSVGYSGRHAAVLGVARWRGPHLSNDEVMLP